MTRLHAFTALLAWLLLLAAGCVAAEPGELPARSSSTPTSPPTAAQEQRLPAPTPAPPTREPGVVTLNAVGDIMLARDLVTLMDTHGSGYPYEAVGELLSDADVTIGNMEGTFTDRGAPLEKQYTFRTPPRHAAGLARAGFDVVSLGNNHAMDFGVAGLQDTLAALGGAGVLHSGAGLDAAAAGEAAVLEHNGLTLAFLSYSGDGTQSSFASRSSAGVARATEAAIRQGVTAARDRADMVIVSIHHGLEYTDEPASRQVTLSQVAIDAGAALVLGHHAHVLQGWQEYGDGIIVYGLGNFVFDLDYDDLQTLGPRPFLTAVLHFELTREGVRSVEARPVFIDPAQNRPVPAEGERRREVEARLQMLNSRYR